MKRPLILLSLLLLLLWNYSCTKNNAEDIAKGPSFCDTLKVMSFKSDIQPILNESCGAQGSCHSNGTASGGVKLEDWKGAHEVAISGILLQSINQTGNVKAMPLGKPKISACYIAKVRRWVAEGALNN